MVEIKRTRESGLQHVYRIYEPGDVVPVGTRIVKYGRRRSAFKGDYVEDINGRLIPLLQRITIDRNKQHTNYIFPGFCWQPWKSEIFSYPLDKAAVEPHLTAKQHYIAMMLKNGLDIMEAVKNAYPKVTKRRLLFLVRNTFQSKAFVMHFLTELGYMSKLKTALEARGINTDVVADHIATMIHDPEAVPSLKKWALETAMEALNEDPRKSAEETEAREVSTTAQLEAAMASRFLPSADLPAQVPASYTVLGEDGDARVADDTKGAIPEARQIDPGA